MDINDLTPDPDDLREFAKNRVLGSFVDSECMIKRDLKDKSHMFVQVWITVSKADYFGENDK